MSVLQLSGPQKPIDVSLNIGGSKSISNRALLIRALTNRYFDISNLSDSDDTQTMETLIATPRDLYDAHHAGTTFRFLTAFLAIQGGEQILTGSDRMKQRPIGPLVEVLNAIGADIKYLNKKAFPPLEIKPFRKQKKNVISIRSDVSSQYISALCMIAPTLEKGLIINLVGELVSKPYLDMTLKMMKVFGVESQFENNTITVLPQAYEAIDYIVESDWSSASYHFAIASLLKGSTIKLNYFFKDSLQGDSAICEIARSFGVSSRFDEHALILESNLDTALTYKYNFLQQPDIAQTVATMAAGKSMQMEYSGLKTLYIKETNRVEALKSELKKVNIDLKTDVENDLYMQTGKLQIKNPTFETYKDHRMAMALAPLSIIAPINIADPDVVSKSYPNFWKDLEAMGFQVS